MLYHIFTEIPNNFALHGYLSSRCLKYANLRMPDQMVDGRSVRLVYDLHGAKTTDLLIEDDTMRSV